MLKCANAIILEYLYVWLVNNIAIFVHISCALNLKWKLDQLQDLMLSIGARFL